MKLSDLRKNPKITVDMLVDNYNGYVIYRICQGNSIKDAVEFIYYPTKRLSKNTNPKIPVEIEAQLILEGIC